ncbi:MAG: serine/threonine-protein kinase, partial [Pseudomonadota bacterium]
MLSRLSDSDHAQSWVARDVDGRGEVVLKVAADGAGAGTAQALLRNEFDLGSRLNHPSIVRYFDHGSDGGMVYLTREYCAQGPIGPMRGRPWQQLLPPLAQIADALAHVHGSGLVHRDVKPGNVVLSADGRAKLMDFGVASEAGAQGLRSGGSPASVSPQQRDGAPPSPADDAYSFGVMLLDLLGARPDP